MKEYGGCKIYRNSNFSKISFYWRMPMKFFINSNSHFFSYWTKHIQELRLLIRLRALFLYTSINFSRLALPAFPYLKSLIERFPIWNQLFCIENSKSAITSTGNELAIVWDQIWTYSFSQYFENFKCSIMICDHDNKSYVDHEIANRIRDRFSWCFCMVSDLL